MTRDQIDVVWQQAMHDAIAEGEQMTRYRFAEMISAIQRQAEPTGKKSLQVESVVAENATTQQQIEQTPPSDYRRGYWDGFNIGKREGRIEAEDALAQQAEPEPVAWVRLESWKSGEEWPDDCFTAEKSEGLTPLYTAPPQRKPLTDEEEE